MTHEPDRYGESAEPRAKRTGESGVGYLAKLPDSRRDIHELPRALEELNESDWFHLISDLAEHPDRLLSRFPVNRGDDAASTALAITRGLGATARRHAARAAGSHLMRLRGGGTIESVAAMAIRFCAALPEESRSSSLRPLLTDPGLPEDLRVRAAFALAQKEDASTLDFFRNDLNYVEHPELAPPAISALTPQNPGQALEILHRTQDHAIDADRFELVTCSALDALRAGKGEGSGNREFRRYRRRSLKHARALLDLASSHPRFRGYFDPEEKREGQMPARGHAAVFDHIDTLPFRDESSKLRELLKRLTV